MHSREAPPHDKHEALGKIGIQGLFLAGGHEAVAEAAVQDAGPAGDEDEFEGAQREVRQEGGEEVLVETGDAAGAEVGGEGSEVSATAGELGEEAEAVEGRFGSEGLGDDEGELNPFGVDRLETGREHR